MFTHSTYRSLSVTILLFSIIAIGLYSIHLKKKEKHIFSVEYYIEEPEDDESEEDIEEQADIETHRAYNEAMEHIAKAEQDFEASQTEFQEQMQAMEEALQNSKTPTDLPKENISETYTQSSEVIHNDNVKRNSTVSYNLENRTAIYLPNPVYTCPESGIIVIHITVDKLGEVIHTNVDNSKSTTTDKCLKEQALEYAKQSKFDTSESSNENQKGTITYRFIGS